MFTVINCSNNFECAGFAFISVAPVLIISFIFTATSVFIMQKRNMDNKLIFKILKLTLRIEEVLLLLALLFFAFVIWYK